MTSRLVLARAEMLRLIARYVPSHVYPDGFNTITKAAIELEGAALEVVPAELPGELLPGVDPVATLLDALPPVYSVPPEQPPSVASADRVDGMHPALGADFEPVPPPVAPMTLEDADGPAELPVAAELGVAAANPEPELPTAAEAVADALAPYEAPKMFEAPTAPTAPSGKSRNRNK